MAITMHEGMYVACDVHESYLRCSFGNAWSEVMLNTTIGVHMSVSLKLRVNMSLDPINSGGEFTNPLSIEGLVKIDLPLLSDGWSEVGQKIFSSNPKTTKYNKIKSS